MDIYMLKINFKLYKNYISKIFCTTPPPTSHPTPLVLLLVEMLLHVHFVCDKLNTKQPP
jgi:hypothetical protein